MSLEEPSAMLPDYGTPITVRHSPEVCYVCKHDYIVKAIEKMRITFNSPGLSIQHFLTPAQIEQLAEPVRRLHVGMNKYLALMVKKEYDPEADVGNLEFLELFIKKQQSEL